MRDRLQQSQRGGLVTATMLEAEEYNAIAVASLPRPKAHPQRQRSGLVAATRLEPEQYSASAPAL